MKKTLSLFLACALLVTYTVNILAKPNSGLDIALPIGRNEHSFNESEFLSESQIDIMRQGLASQYKSVFPKRTNDKPQKLAVINALTSWV